MGLIVQPVCTGMIRTVETHRLTRLSEQLIVAKTTLRGAGRKPVDVNIRWISALVIKTTGNRQGVPILRLYLLPPSPAGSGPHYVPIPRDRSTHDSRVAKPEAERGPKIWNDMGPQGVLLVMK